MREIVFGRFFKMEEYVEDEKEEVGKKWFIEKRKCYSNNLDIFYGLLLRIVKEKELSIKTIGKIDGDKIYLLHNKIILGNPSVLIVTGMHGDEPAGPWGLLEWLENLDKNLLNNINLFIIPLVNPSGFRLGNLRNKDGKNPNRGFVIGLEHNELSSEGKKILNEVDFADMAKGGFLSLHEDYGPKDFYLYLWERSGKQGEFSKKMVDSCNGIFNKFNGKTDGFQAKNGIIFGVDESLGESIDSIEYYTFKKGVPFVACAETPRGYEIEKRIIVHRRVIERFIDFIIKNGKARAN